MSKWLWTLILCFGFVGASSAEGPTAEAVQSEGIYRLPYADGTSVRVFDDFSTHRPRGRIDLFAIDGQRPYRVVAAAAGRVMAIQDTFGERQTGRMAAECHNNYVWIAHANGEWTNYSHLAQGSVTCEAESRRYCASRCLHWQRSGSRLRDVWITCTLRLPFRIETRRSTAAAFSSITKPASARGMRASATLPAGP
jgi:hypothetical protein